MNHSLNWRNIALSALGNLILRLTALSSDRYCPLWAL
jgi:hypothetical protein